MAWVPWIETDDETTNESARELFRETRDPDGAVSDLARITSRTPLVAKRIHQLCRAVYASAKGLTLREKEITALVVSSYIGCVH